MAWAKCWWQRRQQFPVQAEAACYPRCPYVWEGEGCGNKENSDPWGQWFCWEKTLRQSWLCKIEAAVLLAQVGAESLRWTRLSGWSCPSWWQYRFSHGVERAGDGKDCRYPHSGPVEWGIPSIRWGHTSHSAPRQGNSGEITGEWDPRKKRRSMYLPSQWLGFSIVIEVPIHTPCSGGQGTGDGFTQFCCSHLVLILERLTS